MDFKLYISGEKVDLFKDEAVIITQKIKDVRDITKVFADYSQSFSIPASDINNNIFRHIYNEYIQGNDPSEKKEAYIEINSLVWKTGVVKLNSVIMEMKLVKSYNITFISEIIDIKEIVGDALINTLPLSALNHT